MAECLLGLIAELDSINNTGNACFSRYVVHVTIQVGTHFPRQHCSYSSGGVRPCIESHVYHRETCVKVGVYSIVGVCLPLFYYNTRVVKVVCE